MEKTVVVTGIGGNVGQGILRNIRDVYPHIKLVGIDISNFTPANYLCDRCYQVPYAYEKEYIAHIQKIVQKEKVDLIIPSTDHEVYHLSENQKYLDAVVVASDAEITLNYLDKYKSYQYHQKLNIPFAKSWLPKNYDFSEDHIIVKPREGRGSRGLHIDPDRPQGFSDDYIVQELLEGKEITTAIYVKKDNSIHGIFTMERSLTNGTTTQCKVVDQYNDQLMKIIEKMVASGGLRGSFNMQSILTKEGRIVPFEINCRISGTNSIRHQLGFQDVKYALQEYLFQEDPDQPEPRKGIATRILLDIIYPDAEHYEHLNNRTSQHYLY